MNLDGVYLPVTTPFDSTTGDPDGARAVDVVNTYYGRPDIPIGLADPAAALGIVHQLCELPVHALAGSSALQAAEERAGGTRLLAVTVLTSLDGAALDEIGLGSSPAHAADQLATLAMASGVSGFVTSALECSALRESLGETLGWTRFVNST